jgi:ABC-type transporter Mla MlaB component
MLRITVAKNRKTLTFRLEGRLAGLWVRELEDCWQSTTARGHNSIVHVDLTGVTFIDNAGKACLAAMHRQGAIFIAPDCLTKDVVREILEDGSQTTAGEMTT